MSEKLEKYYNYIVDSLLENTDVVVDTLAVDVNYKGVKLDIPTERFFYSSDNTTYMGSDFNCDNIKKSIMDYYRGQVEPYEEQYLQYYYGVNSIDESEKIIALYSKKLATKSEEFCKKLTNKR